jgi:hypothetical protein
LRLNDQQSAADGLRFAPPLAPHYRCTQEVIMKDNAIQWAQNFRRDAMEDGMAFFRDHLHGLNMPDEPERLLNGTIMVVNACCAYLSIDGRPLMDFLAMQTYRPMDDSDAEYSFTFNLFGNAYARILTPIDCKCLDLANLFNHPWHEFSMCGFSDFLVTRIDGNPLSEDEIEKIEKVITDDFRFDYTEEEVDFWTDPDSIEGALYVYVYDVDRDDIEGD